MHRSASLRAAPRAGNAGKEIGHGRTRRTQRIVTGGARGIGRHYSQALAAEGAAVMIADIADGSGLAEELAGKHGRNATASMVCDVSDESQVKALVAKTVERFGKIDILVNNAALYSHLEETEFTEIDVALWDKVMAINVRGPFLLAKHVVPHMRAKGYGKIINIGSGSVFRGMPQMLHYTTSKGAIVAFTRSLSRAVGGSGICVNTLAPGFTLSDSVVENNPDHVQTLARQRDRAPRHQARRPSAGHSGRAGVSGVVRFGFRHRPDHRGRRRRSEYVMRSPRSGRMRPRPALRGERASNEWQAQMIIARTSLRLDAGGLDQLGPFLGLRPHEGVGLGRRHDHRHAARPRQSAP